MAFCIDTDSPEFISLVDGLRDKLGIHAEFEAKRDIYEYNGEFRTSEQVLQKLADKPGPFNPYAGVMEGSVTGNKQDELLQKIIEDVVGDATSYIVKDNRVTIPFSPEGKIKTKEAAEKTAERIAKKLKAQYAGISPNLFIIDTTVDAGAAIKINITDVATANYMKQQGSAYLREDVVEESPLEATEILRATEIATKLASRLSEQIGLDYEVLTPEQAKEIDPNYNGESALFLGGKVYFVGNKLTTEMGLHEFSHPLLRSISIDNNKLFNKLYADLLTTNEGVDAAEKVRRLYPELTTDTDRYKEEVLVHALTAAAQNKLDKLEGSTGFNKVIQNILYAIKQMLRKVFGQKIDVAKLDVNTTLDNLAEMLAKGENFKINTEAVSADDVAAYARSETDYLKDLNKINDPSLQKLVDDMFDKVSYEIKLVQEGSEEEKLDFLVNKYKSGDFEKIRTGLKSYQTRINTDKTQPTNTVEFARQRTTALLNSINVLKNTTEKIHQHLIEISKDMNNRDNIQRMAYYQKMLSYWESFVDNAKVELRANHVDRNSGLYELVSSIDNSINGGKDVLNDIAGKAVRKTLMTELQPTIDMMEEKYQEQLKVFTARRDKATSEADRKAGQAAIDDLKQKYQLSKITPEILEKALRGTLTDEFGKIKDVSWANHFLEGAGYNTDPVFGGLNLYVQNQVTDVIHKVREQANDFGNTMAPLLEKIGYNKNKPGELGEKLGQKEKRIDREGKETEVWTFKNELTGYDFVRDTYLHKITVAADKYQETGTEEDKRALTDIQSEWAQHNEDFWHNKYTPEFYAAQRLLTQDEIGKEARRRRDEIYDQLILLQNTVVDVDDEAEKLDGVEELQRQARRLSNLRNEFGQLKTGDELLIAERLQQFAEATKQFYEQEEIPNAFAEALSDYEQRLIRSGKNVGTDAYRNLRQQWIDRNTRVVVKPEFYDERKAIFNRIEEIMAHLPANEQAEVDISKYWEEILELTKGYRDEDGQPVGAEMTSEKLKRIKHLQGQIDAAREKLATRSGLTKKEGYELNDIFERLLMGDETPTDRVRLQVLMDRKSALGLNRFQRVELNSLYAQLSELQKKVPTDYYVDTMNAWLSSLDTEPMYKLFKLNAITVNTAGFILDDRLLNDMFAQSPEFEAWFRDNHISKPYFDQDLGEELERWERTYAWNVVRPNDDAYYETTPVINESGVAERLQGLPAMKYYKRLIKDEYHTEKVVGETVDNKGRWLPKRGKAAGALDDRYVNQEYARMKQENSDLFKVLDMMKEFHLKHQEQMDPSARLYLDMPRYEKSNIEALQSGNVLQRIIQQIRDFFHKVKNGWDTGLNFKEDAQLATLDIFDDSLSGVPISGKSNLEIEKVSTDIGYSMMRYLMSGQKQKKLIEMSPIARSLQDIVNNEENVPILESTIKNRSIRFLNKKKDSYMRSKAINNFVEREFEGQINKGWGSDSAIAQNMSKLLFKQASAVYLTMNIPSAVKNAANAKLQGLIEAVAGRYMTTKTYAAAEGWAVKTTLQISTDIYKQGSKSLDVQIVELFDPAGKVEAQIGESMTRSIGKDLAMFKWMNDPRRWSELQATLHIFGAMMKHVEVEQNGKKINYLDAWELRDGQITLKEGIDKEWGVGGKKFLAKRNQLNNVTDNLNGAFRREQSPEGQRYLVFRYLSFLRRWLPSLIANRFAYSGSILKGSSRGRVNYLLGGTQEGFYVSTIKLLGKTLKSLGRNLPYMSREEKASALRFSTEVAALLLLMGLIHLIGWDGDDDERYKKLKKESGPLGFLGLVHDDPNRAFNLGGYLHLHMLKSLMEIKAEGAQMLPLPGMGLNQYIEYVSTPSTLAVGPNLKLLGKLAQDMVYAFTGDDRQYYKRSVGPYEAQTEGNRKIWAHLSAAVGLTGGTLDPAIAIKNLQANQARTK